MMTPDGRAWCYVFQYPEKKPCMAGTVLIRLGAPDHEIHAACHEHWRGIFPFDPAPIIKLVPGSLVFIEEKS